MRHVPLFNQDACNTHCQLRCCWAVCVGHTLLSCQGVPSPIQPRLNSSHLHTVLQRSVQEILAQLRQLLIPVFKTLKWEPGCGVVCRFKQRGKEAQEACNVFYYLTYEGAVNLDQIEDPTQLKVTCPHPAYSCAVPMLLLAETRICDRVLKLASVPQSRRNHRCD